MQTNKKLLIAILGVFALALFIPGMLFAANSAGEPQTQTAAQAQATATPAAATQPVTTTESLYLPRHLNLDYQFGVRSLDGKPGPKYFQNKAVHNMTITVAPPSRTVSATQEISYTNNSPFPLPQLMIRLYLNAHLPQAQREDNYTPDFLTDGIIIDKVSINGTPVEWQNAFPLNTIKKLTLPKPLGPGETVNLSFDWHYDLAKEAQKEGVVDPTTFYLAYFFPRVSVVSVEDGGFDVEEFTYRSGRELWNDFADFTFNVNVPKNYVVWATGDLKNPEEVLLPEVAKRLKDSFTSDKVVNIAQPEDTKAGKVTAQTDTVTWKWQADNINDIAIGLSDHYIWDAGSVVVDPATNRRASVQSAYPVEATDYKTIVDAGKRALTFGSTDYPGVPYPYPKATIFVGGADEEYPMMANDAATLPPSLPKEATVDFVAAHELLHSWFPFYMGTDERRYPMLDEGWTTAFEYLFGLKDVGKQAADNVFKGMRSSRVVTAGPGTDIPIITASDSTRGTVAGSNNSYEKPALAYLALKDYLGDAKFKQGLQEFIKRWNGKHPLPWDMFYTFNDVTGENLNWFWNNWFFSNHYMDLKVGDVKKAGSGYDVTVNNVGGFAIPFDVVVIYADGTQETIHQTPAVWKDSPHSATVTLKQEPKAVVLDGGIFMDATAQDNQWGTLPPVPTPKP